MPGSNAFLFRIGMGPIQSPDSNAQEPELGELGLAALAFALPVASPELPDPPALLEEEELLAGAAAAVESEEDFDPPEVSLLLSDFASDFSDLSDDALSDFLSDLFSPLSAAFGLAPDFA